MTENDIMVSICCITYNHEAFVKQAIDGFLMQKTNFRFEIIIGDDCSTDGTRKILHEYKKRYPDLIKLIARRKNIGAHRNFRHVVECARGKYLAHCEGDDFWTDCNKLQKQVDFLEQNPDYIICCNYTRVIDQNENTLYVNEHPLPLIHTYYDLLEGKQEETKTASLVYRNNQKVRQLYNEDWFYKAFAADKMIRLFVTYSTQGKIYVMPEVMSCYRNHQGGIWSMIDAKVRMRRMISDFNLIIKHFTYPALLKKKLLLLYVKRYLLFELKNLEIRKAYHTVKYLLQ